MKETEDRRVSKADTQMKCEESHAAGYKGTEKQNIAFVLHIFVLSFVTTSTEIYKIMKVRRTINTIQWFVVLSCMRRRNEPGN